jgi:hypothetical protein
MIFFRFRFFIFFFLSTNKILLVLQNNAFYQFLMEEKIGTIITNISQQEGKREREKKNWLFFKFWKCNNNLPKHSRTTSDRL